MTEEIIIENAFHLCQRLEQENKKLLEARNHFMAENLKYFNVLEEIREIAKDIVENDVYENSDVKAENILTKINEVLE